MVLPSSNGIKKKREEEEGRNRAKDIFMNK